MSFMFRFVCNRIVQAAFLSCLALRCGPLMAAPQDPVRDRIERLFELSESSKEDALQQLLALQEGLSTQANFIDQRTALSTLIFLYIQNDLLDAASRKNLELDALAERFNDNWSRSMTLNFSAYLLRNEGKPAQARTQIEKAIVISQTVGDRMLTSAVHRTAGIIDEAAGDFQSALKHELLALDSVDGNSRGAEIWRVTILFDIGQLYSSLKNVEMALEYNERATRIAETIRAEDKLEVLLIHRGNIYSAQNKLDDAFNAYSRALELSQASTIYINQFLALTNLSDVTYQMGNYRQCLHFADQALRLNGKVSGNYYLGVANINAGLCQMRLGDLRHGSKQVEDGVTILKKIDDRTTIESALGQLADAYAKGGMYHEAFQTLSEKTALTLELFSLNRDHMIAELQSRYTSMQQQKKILELEQQSRLQKADIRNKNLLQVIAVLVSLIALFLASSIYLLYRKVKRSNLRLKEANLSLEFQSKRDPLTGLLNRRAFYDTLKKRRKASERRLNDAGRATAALVMLDIDQFKLINDTFGHTVGDIVLVEVSQRLSGIMRDNDKLMRWGGEEFLLYLNNMDPDSLQRIVDRILFVIGASPIEIEVQKLNVTVSIGFILLDRIDDTDSDLERVMKLVDASLYRAKIGGRNRAIGVSATSAVRAECNAMVSIDLDALINEKKISITTIHGPAQPDSAHLSQA
jgi:diguanylate cyclase (GGDEF)-like protein